MEAGKIYLSSFLRTGLRRNQRLDSMRVCVNNKKKIQNLGEAGTTGNFMYGEQEMGTRMYAGSSEVMKT